MFHSLGIINKLMFSYLLETAVILITYVFDHIFIKQYKPAADHTIFDSGRLNAILLTTFALLLLMRYYISKK